MCDNNFDYNRLKKKPLDKDKAYYFTCSLFSSLQNFTDFKSFG